MPYVKPETLLQLQIAASEVGVEAYDRDDFNVDKLRGAMRICVVCGDTTCDKHVVKVNNVYVHREDVAAADNIDKPELGDNGND